jgi:hypothetical protein
MNLFKTMPSLLSVPLLLSVIVHGVIFAGVSDTRLFDYRYSRGGTPISATLLADNTSSHVSHATIRSLQYVSGQRVAGREKKESSGESGNPVPDAPASLESVSSFNRDISSEGPTEPSTVTNNLSVIPSTYHPLATQPVPALTQEDIRIPLASAPTPSFSPPESTAQDARPENRSALLKCLREKLSFNLYWLDVYVGKAEIEAVNNQGHVLIRSQIHSAPVISTFYKVEDDASSVVVDGAPVDFRIKQREGKYRSDKEIVFDPEGKHVTFINYIKGIRDEHPLDGGGLWDLISGFYYLRTQLFEIGKNIYINIFDSDKFYKAEVDVIGKERIRLSETKELNTVVVKPILKSEGLFMRTGEILIWLTDDDNKTPVRIETKVPIGKVVAILTSLETE